MRDPVLVVHGVANRDEEEFFRVVSDLADRTRLGDRRFVPVYWGDLGAALNGLEHAIPRAERGAVRSDDGIDENAADLALGMLASPSSATVRAPPEADTATAAAEAFMRRAGTNAVEGVLVRAGDDEAVRREFEAAWHGTAWLKQIDDRQLLSAIGAAAAEGAGLDGSARQSPVRGLDVRDLGSLVRRVVHGIDRSVGAVLAAAGGELNSFVRGQLAPALGAFIGDVFVYQAHREVLHRRIRGVLEREAPGHGTAAAPVAVLGHSLGGVMSWDLAVLGDPPLHISHLITFGSQSAFFHILDPRVPNVIEFVPGTPSALPPTLGAWTNLWEPLDPLAFIAARVFMLASGAPPDDRPLRHLASTKLWTHSAYWRSPELLLAIREALT